MVAIEGGLAQADWASFSNDAAAAVLFSAEAGRMQVITGLPGAARVAFDFDASLFPERARTAAVSEDGRLLLIGSIRGVYAIDAQGTARLVFSGAAISSVALLRNGTDAVVSDQRSHAVHVIENAGGSPTVRVLASGLKGRFAAVSFGRRPEPVCDAGGSFVDPVGGPGDGRHADHRGGRRRGGTDAAAESRHVSDFG